METDAAVNDHIVTITKVARSVPQVAEKNEAVH